MINAIFICYGVVILNQFILMFFDNSLNYKIVNALLIINVILTGVPFLILAFGVLNEP